MPRYLQRLNNLDYIHYLSILKERSDSTYRAGTNMLCDAPDTSDAATTKETENDVSSITGDITTDRLTLKETKGDRMG